MTDGTYSATDRIEVLRRPQTDLAEFMFTGDRVTALLELIVTVDGVVP